MSNIHVVLNIKTAELQKMTKNMRKVQAEIEKAAAVSIYRFGLRVMRKAKKRTPVDTDQLRGSAYVMIPRNLSKSTTSSIGYGDVPYAEEVHENPIWFHAIGEYKFFERTVREFRGDYVSFISRNIRPMIRSGMVPRITPAADMKKIVIKGRYTSSPTSNRATWTKSKHSTMYGGNIRKKTRAKFVPT